MERVFNKLVRDKVPEIIENKGEKVFTRVLDDEEYKLQLLKKLGEECSEVILATDSEEILEELADIYEVIRAIAASEGKSIKDVEGIAKEKRENRGGFEKKILLEKTKKIGDKK